MKKWNCSEPIMLFSFKVSYICIINELGLFTGDYCSPETQTALNVPF